MVAACCSACTDVWRGGDDLGTGGATGAGDGVRGGVTGSAACTAGVDCARIGDGAGEVGRGGCFLSGDDGVDVLRGESVVGVLLPLPPYTASGSTPAAASISRTASRLRTTSIGREMACVREEQYQYNVGQSYIRIELKYLPGDLLRRICDAWATKAGRAWRPTSCFHRAR